MVSDLTNENFCADYLLLALVVMEGTSCNDL